MPSYTVTSPAFGAASPVNYGYIAASAIFYIFVAFTAVYSLAAMFVLVRHAQSRLTAFGASALYGLIYLALVTQGTSILSSLK